MKVISIITIIVMAWGVPAFGGMSLLTEAQMSSVTGGFEPVEVVNVSDQDAVGGFQASDDPTSFIVNDDVAVLNLVNLSETIVDNSVLNDNSVSTLVLENDAQREAIAVNIVNSIHGKVANGLNVTFLHDTSLHLDSPLTSLNQSNIIIQK